MTDNNFTSAVMADLLRQKIDKVQDQCEASKREIVTTKAVPVTTETIVHEPKKVQLGGKLVRGVRAKDNVSIYLSNLKTAESVTSRVTAWQKVIEIVVKYPKKAIFDEIFEFFKANKNSEFLQESVALQGLTELDFTVHQRIRILYMVMLSMARGDANRKNVAIDLLRNIFNNDDFATWVSIKLKRR